MLKFEEIHTNHRHYPFVETLLHSAFPKEERRDDPQQRANTDLKPHFHCMIVLTESNTPIGLLTYWDFTQFLYIEHFAIDADQRNKGYGQEALTMLLNRASVPIVLEAEIPQRHNDQASRRINFYKRMGFKLRKTPYRQPPYRRGDNWLPMKLMTYGELMMKVDVINHLYWEVYEVRK